MSGQKLIVEAAIQTFNLVYVAFPIVWAAVLDQDLDQDSAQRFPYAYREGPAREHMRPWRLAAWAAAGIWEGAAIAIGLALWLGAGASPGPWSQMDVFSLGQAAFTSMIIVLNVQVAVAVAMHHWSFRLVTAASVAVWVPAALVFDSLNADGTRGAVPLLFGSASFWLAQLLVLSLAVLPMAAARAAARAGWPSFARVALEAQALFRRGQHDAALMVDRHDPDGDAWATRPGFETEPEPACRLGRPAAVPWDPVADALRKHPFALKLAAARAAAEHKGLGAAAAAEAEAAMRDRIDRVLVGRGWPKGVGGGPRGGVTTRRSPLEAVAVRP